MNLIENYDFLTLVLLSFIALLIAGSIFFWSLKQYEIVIILILLSPWVHCFFVRNGPTSVEANPGSYIRVSMILILGMIGYLNFFKLKLNSQEKFPFQVKLLLGLLLFALLSTIYSIDKFYTFIRAFEFIAFCGFLLGFYYWLKDISYLDKALSIFFWVITSVIIINLISLVLFPSIVWYWKAPSRFQGLLGHPNSLGGFCMVSYPLLMWKYKRAMSKNKLWIVLLFCGTLFMQILSGSRASLVTSLFGFFVWSLMLNKKGMILILSCLLLFAGVLFTQVKLAPFERGGTAITDLKGRPEFWRGCIQLIKERPIYGYGYEVSGKIWTDPRFYRSGIYLWKGSARASLHNGYLAIAVGLGLTGLIVWLIIVIISIRRIIFFRPCIYKAVVLTIIFQCLLVNFFESTLSTGSKSTAPLAFWLCIVIATKLPFLVPVSSVGLRSAYRNKYTSDGKRFQSLRAVKKD